jgi:hypothetical protein
MPEVSGSGTVFRLIRVKEPDWPMTYSACTNRHYRLADKWTLQNNAELYCY